MGRFWRAFRTNYREMLYYGLLVLLIFVPLYPKFPLISIKGSYVPVRLEDVMGAGLLGVWIWGNWGRWRQVWQDRLNQAVIVFLAGGLVSLVSAIWVTATVTPHLGLLHWIRRVEYMGLFLVARQAMWERRQLSVFVVVLMLVTVGVAIYGLGQIYLGFPVISTQNVEFSKGIALRLAPGARLSSTFAGHYDLSAFCVLVMPIVVGVLAVSRSMRERVVSGGVFLASLWLLLASASRISFPAALGGMWVSLGVLGKWRWLGAVTVVTLVGFGLSGDLAARYQQVIRYESGKVMSKVRNKLRVQVPPVVWAAEKDEQASESGAVLPANVVVPTPIPTPVREDRSSSIRLNVEWPRAVRAFKKNPLLGTGVSSITLATDNDYLRLLGEMGMVGFLAFGLVFLRLAGVFGRAIRSLGERVGLREVYMAGMMGVVVGILINATFIDVFEASKVAMVFWVLAGLAVETVRLKK